MSEMNICKALDGTVKLYLRQIKSLYTPTSSWCFWSNGLPDKDKPFNKYLKILDNIYHIKSLDYLVRNEGISLHVKIKVGAGAQQHSEWGDGQEL